MAWLDEAAATAQDEPRIWSSCTRVSAGVLFRAALLQVQAKKADKWEEGLCVKSRNEPAQIHQVLEVSGFAAQQLRSERGCVIVCVCECACVCVCISLSLSLSLSVVGCGCPACLLFCFPLALSAQRLPCCLLLVPACFVLAPPHRLLPLLL